MVLLRKKISPLEKKLIRRHVLLNLAETATDYVADRARELLGEDD